MPAENSSFAIVSICMRTFIAFVRYFCVRWALSEMMRFVRWMFAVVVALLVFGAGVAFGVLPRSAGRGSAGAGTVVALHPGWRLAWSNGFSDVIGDGRYALLLSPSPPTALLIDEQTGRRTRLSGDPSERGCQIVSIGFPWVLANCSGAAALYSIPTGKWRSVAPPPPPPACIACIEMPRAVGRFWIKWTVVTSEGPDSWATSYVFENIADASLRTDPTNATTIANPDHPGLSQHVCSPLRVPPPYGTYPFDTIESLTFDGAFAIVQQQAPQHRPEDAPPVHTSLRRCSSRLNRAIGSYVGGRYPHSYAADSYPANAHALIWYTAHGRLNGLFLPSLRRFVTQLPPAAAKLTSDPVAPIRLALTARTLYVIVTDTSRLPWRPEIWTARSPTELH